MKLKRINKAESKTTITEKKPKRNKKLTQRDLMIERLKMLESISKPSVDQQEEIEELKLSIQRSKRGKNSKAKGATYERNIAKKFQTAYGIELARTPQSGGFAKKSEKAEDFRGDILPVDKDLDLKLHVECKDQKTWCLPQWLNQAESDAPKGKVPVVIFHKYNTSKDYVTLSLEDFFSLVSREKIVLKGSRK